MSQGWDNHEPAPMEFFHGQLMKHFHEYRKRLTDSTEVLIDGIVLNNIVAKAKVETYEKYPKQKLGEAILKTDM